MLTIEPDTFLETQKLNLLPLKSKYKRLKYTVTWEGWKSTIFMIFLWSRERIKDGFGRINYERM